MGFHNAILMCILIFSGGAKADEHHTSPTSSAPSLISKTWMAEGDIPGAVTAANPVNFHTGAKMESATDYAGVGSHLEFSRFYTSAAGLQPVTLMGVTWRHTYMRNVITVDAETVKVTRPSGDAYTYRKRFGEWMRDPDVAYLLEEITSGGMLTGWVLRAPDDSEEFFDANGLLTAIAWTDGEVLSLIYSAGLLSTVVDVQGRSLSMSYTDGKLTGVALPDGKALVYSYDTAGRLNLVQFNDGAAVTQVAAYGYANTSYPEALTERWDESNAVYASWTYDASGRAVTSVHGNPTGSIDKVTFAYSPGSTVVTDSLGHASTISTNILHGRAKSGGFSHPCPSCNGQTFASQTYDVNGYPDTQVDFKGAVTDIDYSPEGLVVKRVEAATDAAARRTIETSWHSNFRRPTQRDTRDNTNTLKQRQSWTYNTRGQVLTSTTTDPTTSISRTTSFAYCEAADITAATCPREGLLLSVDGPLAGTVDRTTYTYYAAHDASCASMPTTCPHRKGDLWKVTNALGQVSETLAYDGAGRVLSMKDANGIITDREYHPRGWLTATKVRGANNSVETDDVISRIEYWSTGLVKKVTRPDGAYTQYAYDQAHRLTDVTDNTGNKIHYTLDNAGNRIAEETRDSSNMLKRSLSRVFNQLGQLETQADSQANPTDFTYDANGNSETVTDALETVTSNDYDPLNRLATTLQDVGGIEAETGFAYDALDNLVTVTDPKGLDTNYTYNGLGDLTQLSSPDTGVTSYTYDAAGNRRTQTDSRGITATYSYDGLGRLTSVAYPTSALDVAYIYDTTQTACATGETYSVGRLTRMNDASGHTQYCYDRFGRLARKVQTTNGIAFTVRYLWTVAGQLSGMVYPDGTEVDYTRNALGQIAAMGVTRPGQAREVLLDQATYLPYGPVSGWTYGNGRTMVRSYDQDYRPVAIEDDSPGGLSLGFGYDAAGNLTKLGTAAGVAAPDVTFDYDTLGRLTATKDGPTQVAIDAYAYDATGNRLFHTTAAGTSSYTYPSTNHHLTDVAGMARTYDDVGNTTTIGSGRDFVYSDANRMSQVKNGDLMAMNYAYNGLGEQVHRHLGGGSEYTAYDEGGRWLGDYDNSGAPLQQTLWMDNLPVGVLTSGGQFHYIEPDHLGSSRVVIELARNVAVWEWSLKGEAFGSTAPKEDVDADAMPFVLNMRFPGQRYDLSSKLNLNGHRDFDTSTGRYHESDPLGQWAGSSTFAYVESSPLNSIDPEGLAAELILFNTSYSSNYKTAAEKFNSPLGVCTVAGHGDRVSMRDAQNNRVTPQMLAEMIRNEAKCKDAKAILLLSCDTGADSLSIAQQLANILGIPVVAPDVYVFFRGDGSFFLGRGDRNLRYIPGTTGRWVQFIPGGRPWYQPILDKLSH